MRVLDCGPGHRYSHLPRCSLGAVTLETMPTIAELKTILTRAKSRGIFCSFDPNLRSTARLLHMPTSTWPNPAASALGYVCTTIPTTAASAPGIGLTAATSAPGLGLGPATSASGLGSALPHLHRDWAHPCSTSSPGLGPPLPHLRRDWARSCHICTGTGLGPATSAPGLGSALPC
jgi:hypothetical protein